ncbi:hypothetical protein E6W39_01180 [Kitasatospora acidiphila]|uniref:Uncharacterized protein n=1 Tax=Kitasatospora acidiphila TaxID=2567942 RepID=A0A540WG18_9ACTN|nr:hypothetical protein E6W39_01180 [Kitasatospora acidiphila]
MTVMFYAPPVTPGCQRVRPLPRESTASYLTRLAHAYRQSLPQLLDALAIAVDAQGKSHPNPHPHPIPGCQRSRTASSTF